MLIVYKPQDIPNCRHFLNVWREFCRSSGIGEIYIIAALTLGNNEFEKYGFDAGIEFPPHNHFTSSVNKSNKFYSSFRGNIIDYISLANSYLNRDYGPKQVFPTLIPSWDNTARRGKNSTVLINSSPENFQYWLQETLNRTSHNIKEKIIFVNAWNGL